MTTPASKIELIPSRGAIRSLPLDGKQPLYYYPDLNLLTFDGEADRLCAAKEFKDVLFRYFLGIRRLTALQQAQQPPQVLFIEPWRKCNLACTYCYAKSGPAYTRKTDPKKLTSLLKRYNFKRALVFGGEPLLDAQFLLDLRRSQHWDNFFFSTNGLLLGEKSSQELLGIPNTSLQLSLEPEDWSYRVTVNGKKQIELIRDQLKLLRDSNPSLRVTFPAQAPHFSIQRFVDGLAEAIGSHNFSISYWPARDPKAPTWLKDWIQESHQLAAKDDEMKYKGKLPGCHMASYFSEMANAKNGFRFHNCNAGYGSVSIGPDNLLHGCHELAVEESKLDRVCADHNGIIIDEEKRSALVDKWSNVMDPSVCSGCPARYVCGGVCFILEPPHSACAYMVDMIGLALAEMIRYNTDEVMSLVSRSEEHFNKLYSLREGLAKEVNCKKWNRLLSGELPLAEAVELAGRLLNG